jgi:hypothetical protein
MDANDVSVAAVTCYVNLSNRCTDRPISLEIQTSRTGLGRNKEWFINTWHDYIKPKYNAALNRWDMETGGGDGTATSFHRYCGSEKWLAWIYLCDLDADHVLKDWAQRHVPKHIQNEAGVAVASEGSDAFSKPTRKSVGSLLEGAIKNSESQLEKHSQQLELLTTAILRHISVPAPQAASGPAQAAPAAPAAHAAPAAPAILSPDSHFARLQQKLDDIDRRDTELHKKREAASSPSSKEAIDRQIMLNDKRRTCVNEKIEKALQDN